MDETSPNATLLGMVAEHGRCMASTSESTAEVFRIGKDGIDTNASGCMGVSQLLYGALFCEDFTLVLRTKQKI
jgi:hypothetical protein